MALIQAREGSLGPPRCFNPHPLLHIGSLRCCDSGTQPLLGESDTKPIHPVSLLRAPDPHVCQVAGLAARSLPAPRAGRQALSGRSPPAVPVHGDGYRAALRLHGHLRLELRGEPARLPHAD